MISMIVFMLVMILLVVVLLYARQKLTPQGDVTLKINDREPGSLTGIKPALQPCQAMIFPAFGMRRRRYLRYVQVPE
ncbi:MAG: hypothetical protein MZV63_32590 [Marinilabiliales bacterium]|nr:hypothetical protein [Marinilabiliales bacterium]